jgi:hypothetical protein
MRKYGPTWVLLPGLLLFHGVLSSAVVVWGRGGLERTLGLPGASIVGAVLALVAVIGLAFEARWATDPLERFALGLAALLPGIWLYAMSIQVDYDTVAAALSATVLGESRREFWFSGIPVAALSYSLVLLMFAFSCGRAVSRQVGLHNRRSAYWLVGALCIASFAGTVHLATGW